jgi:CubicO group peptidase (beta-lactamase class C family)
MPHRILVVAVLTLISSAITGAGQGAKFDSASIGAYVQKFVDLERFNGAVLVAVEDGIAFKHAYGMADFEWSIRNTTDTRFRLASITKQFTSMLIMQLVDEGRLSLDDRLADRVPYYRKDTGGKVTIHHLLSHTSGIPNFTSIPNMMRDHSRTPLRLRELVTQFCSGDLEFEPGEKFAYSNSGYVILGAIIEQVTGKAYEESLRERVFAPLGMNSSGYDHSETLIARRAAGYDRDLRGLRNCAYLEMSLPFAAGALYSTVEDLYLWDRALYGTQLLSEAARNRMFTPGIGGYAYGWFVGREAIGPGKAERTVMQHFGVINGFSSLILRIPEDRVLVVLLNNTGGTTLVPIAQGIEELLYGRAPKSPKESIASVLQRTIAEKGVEAAMAQCREIREKQAVDYDMDEEELERLGSSLLKDGKADEAIMIFKLTIEAFPGSWEPHDSLAEAYAAKGEQALAIQSYARSLELNPKNSRAVRRLQELIDR